MATRPVDRRPRPSVRTIVVTCRTCGRDYEATGDMIIAGVWQRACPHCHPPHTDDDLALAAA